MRIVETAPAKINLALHIRERLPDGYHRIETIFAFARDGDVLTVEPAAEWSLTITGPFASELNQTASPAKAGVQDRAARNWAPASAGEDENLVIRAAKAFTDIFPKTQPHAITLDKRLPIASGIGGGSADAAATLRALARLHGVALDDPRLVAVATSLGADVPACLLGQTSFGTNRGDVVTPIESLRGTPLLLVNPRVEVSTAAAYRGWDGVDRGPLADGPLLDRTRAGRNDLAPPAIALAPIIGEVGAMLASASGALLARMSGSGATCFALFQTNAERDQAAVAAEARGWWTLASTLA